MNILGRAVTTILIWLIGMAGVIGLINQTVRPAYTLMEQPTFVAGDGVVETVMVPIITGTEYAPVGTVAILALLALFLVIAMTISTAAIWRQARHEASAPREAAAVSASVKLKRDQQARLQRLLARMDPDDLAALEHHLTALEDQVGLGADGELIGGDDMRYERAARRG
jgi:hypothetical protein